MHFRTFRVIANIALVAVWAVWDGNRVWSAFGDILGLCKACFGGALLGRLERFGCAFREQRGNSVRCEDCAGFGLVITFGVHFGAFGPVRVAASSASVAV